MQNVKQGKMKNDRNTFHYNNYLVLEEICTSLGLSRDSNVMVDFFKFLSTESEVESSRTSMASRTHFEVLGLEAQALGLEVYKSSKIICPWLEDSIVLKGK